MSNWFQKKLEHWSLPKKSAINVPVTFNLPKTVGSQPSSHDQKVIASFSSMCFSAIMFWLPKTLASFFHLSSKIFTKSILWEKCSFIEVTGDLDLQWQTSVFFIFLFEPIFMSMLLIKILSLHPTFFPMFKLKLFESI